MFQVYLNDSLKADIFKSLNKSDDDKNEIFNYIISSYKKTNYERFLFEIYNLINFRKEGRIDSKTTKQKIKWIADEFFWVIHDYLGQIVDEAYVNAKIMEFEKDMKTLEMHIKGTIERINKIEEIKKELPIDLLKKVSIIQELLFIYNERKKEVLNQANIYIRRFFEYKFPNKSISQLRMLYQLMPEEIIKLFKCKKIENLEKRNEHWVYYICNEKISKGGDFYFSLITVKETGILKGIPASPGIVKGRINMILNISHIYKFNEGDILVAPFTNVNYLPIMSKAKAILTETGGMTSHAAIVSRELKKPCIVNIKNLFMGLKDGDLVEVDADNGVVRKIK